MFANLTVGDGRILTGQNQNVGPETAEKMMMLLERTEAEQAPISPQCAAVRETAH